MPFISELQGYTANRLVIQWIQEIANLCKPKNLFLCDGSEEEYEYLCADLVAKGVFIPLNPKARPGSFWCRSDPSDVARVEEVTFICSKKKEDAGPTNHWKDPEEMKNLLLSLFSGCMEGRTMYIIPYSMGPLGSDIGHIGVQITDSAYVACNMKLMTRIGTDVLKVLKDGFFVPCLHSVGVPLKEGQKDSFWPCRSDHKYIAHFPEEKSIWSFGSGYGGNALLGKKCFALRIASVMAREQSWLAEHMLILGLTNPKGKKKYIAAAFPSQCGKTNLSMVNSELPGWKVECVGDDIAWLKFGSDGHLYAINPEAGFFGVAPGTSFDSNPNAMLTIQKNTIFTNVALTKDFDVWWEGMTKIPPDSLMSWKGLPWNPSSKEPAAHPNARFTVSAEQCPVIDPQWDNPMGVPISAIVFGGRRASTVPLVYEAMNWTHGVFLGASVSSETTAAASGDVGKLRHDPFAMLPFCGYHMGDYFAHWLNMGKTADSTKLPRIYSVNWFRKSKDGKWLWPGFKENIRVLKWIFERIDHQVHYQESPIGYLPDKTSFDTSGLSLSKDILDELFAVRKDDWLNEVKELRSYFTLFGDKLPSELTKELDALEKRF